MMRPSTSPRTHVFLCAALAFLLPLFIFLPSVRFDLVDLDDGSYIVNNRLATAPLTLSGLKEAFVSRGPANLHVPVVWISYMVDVALFGNHPWAFHFSNTLWHAWDALLLFFLLWRLARTRIPADASPFIASPWPALLLSLLWALHPLRVESVAWATERKDCLAVFFGLLVIHAWLSALDSPRPGPRLFHGLASFLFFALGLLAKPSLVPLPVFLAFAALLPSRPRPRLLPLWLSLLPFFVLSLVSSRTTTSIHDFYNQIVPPPVLYRLATVPSVAFFYVFKTLFPFHLAVIYPKWTSPLWLGILLSIPLALAAMWIFRKRRSLPLLWLGAGFAFLFFLPVSGIIPIPFNLVADRYACLPSIGLAIALLPLFAGSRPRRVAILFVLLVCACAVATSLYLPTWRNSTSVYLPARRFVPDNHAIRMYDASLATRHGDYLASHRCIERGLNFFPDEALMLADVPNINALSGTSEALRLLQEYRPRTVLLPLWTFHAASLQLMLAQCEEAMATVEENLPFVQPADPMRNVLLQIAMVAAYRDGQSDVALRYARQSGRIPPGGNSVEPLRFFPYYLVLWDNGYQAEALRYFRELAADPDASPQTLNNIAWFLATSLYSPAPPSESVALARRALDAIGSSNPSRSSLLDTLAAAQANAGQFSDAVFTLSSALAVLSPDAPSRKSMEYRLSLYQRNLPYREWAERPVPLDEYGYDSHL